MAKWIVAALALLAVPQERNLGNSYLGKAPPELANEGAKWLNVPGPLALEKLRGKVVWIEFGFLKCAPCKKLKPTLIRWHKEYAEKGLVVIDVSDGSQDAYDALKKEVEEKEEKFAVLWDKDAKVCLAYGIQAYPQAYLVGADGKVVWEGSPGVKTVDQIEKVITAELEKIKK